MDNIEMSTSEIRKENLKKIIGNIKQHGRIAQFSRENGIDPTYLRQIFSGHRALGEKAARKLEEKIGLASYALDQNSSSNLLLREIEKKTKDFSESEFSELSAYVDLILRRKRGEF